MKRSAEEIGEETNESGQRKIFCSGLDGEKIDSLIDSPAFNGAELYHSPEDSPVLLCLPRVFLKYDSQPPELKIVYYVESSLSHLAVNVKAAPDWNQGNTNELKSVLDEIKLLFDRPKCPLALVYGDDSYKVPDQRLAGLQPEQPSSQSSQSRLKERCKLLKQHLRESGFAINEKKSRSQKSLLEAVIYAGYVEPHDPNIRFDGPRWSWLNNWRAKLDQSLVPVTNFLTPNIGNAFLNILRSLAVLSKDTRLGRPFVAYLEYLLSQKAWYQFYPRSRSCPVTEFTENFAKEAKEFSDEVAIASRKGHQTKRPFATVHKIFSDSVIDLLKEEVGVESSSDPELEEIIKNEGLGNLEIFKSPVQNNTPTWILWEDGVIESGLAGDCAMFLRETIAMMRARLSPAEFGTIIEALSEPIVVKEIPESLLRSKNPVMVGFKGEGACELNAKLPDNLRTHLMSIAEQAQENFVRYFKMSPSEDKRGYLLSGLHERIIRIIELASRVKVDNAEISFCKAVVRTLGYFKDIFSRFPRALTALRKAPTDSVDPISSTSQLSIFWQMLIFSGELQKLIMLPSDNPHYVALKTELESFENDIWSALIQKYNIQQGGDAEALCRTLQAFNCGDQALINKTVDAPWHRLIIRQKIDLSKKSLTIDD